MGKFNINQIMYIVRRSLKGVKWLVPKKYKKYVYLLASVLGLLAYFNLMLYLTNSKYLFAMKNVLVETFNFLINNFDHKILYLICILIVVLFVTRYFRQPDNTEKDGVKKSNGSIYYQVNAMISISYLGITILGLLPMFL